MRIRNRLSAAVALLASGAAGSAAAAEASGCTLSQAAELPITMRGTRPLVTLKVNGQDALFLTDSGAFYSTMSLAAAERLKLPLLPTPAGMYIGGVGGAVRVSQAKVADGKLDQIQLKNAIFLVTEGPAEFGRETAGVLGQNLLGLFDMEYDLANGVIRLITSKGCTDIQPVYWRQPGQDVSEVVIDATEKRHDQNQKKIGNSHLRGSATINGTPIRVMFDTGASSSVLSLTSARKLGFQPDGDGVRAVGFSGGIGAKLGQTWVAPFKSFEVGGEEIRNAKLRVSDIELGDDDMLIGADFFLSHRIYIARKQNRLFFTYNGGPVFNLDREPVQSTEQVKASAPATASAGDPTDVGGLTRRGLASLARRDYPRAIADFDRVIALDPKLADTYFHRATARLGARQNATAMADLDQAIRLKPDYTRALLLRGQQFLERKDLAHASADFDAAIKADGPSADTRLGVAALYADAGQYEASIAQHDILVGEHPKGEKLAEALNGRCWTRALWGKELDKALADCDAALKEVPGSPNVLDSRGLVKLRLVQLDAAIADYDAALKRQPKIAWSLYGRGLAKLRRGMTAAGEADIAAAVAIQPNIRKRGEEIGLEPATKTSAPVQP